MPRQADTPPEQGDSQDATPVIEKMVESASTLPSTENAQESSPEEIAQGPLQDITSNVPMDTVSGGKRPAMFKGVKVKAGFLPVLNAIWEKYGDGKSMKLKSTTGKSCAYEATAEIVLTLFTLPAKDLMDIDIETIAPLMEDLQEWNFDIQWLAPYVARAEAVVKGKAAIEDIK